MRRPARTRAASSDKASRTTATYHRTLPRSIEVPPTDAVLYPRLMLSSTAGCGRLESLAIYRTAYRSKTKRSLRWDLDRPPRDLLFVQNRWQDTAGGLNRQPQRAGNELAHCNCLEV
jgi:hypothetical protein